jgi:hypothetical protein
MYNAPSSSPTLTNCTFTGNSANGNLGDGGGIYNEGSSPTLTNCILWGDFGAGGYGLNGSEIYFGSGTSGVTYCDIQGGLAGTGNINANPQFVNAAGGNLELQPTSPCINVGNNAAIEATGMTTDLAGNPRIYDGVVDMGAYEAQAVTITWTGNDDGISWSDATNWSDNLVPDRNDTVIIPAGVPVVDIGGVFSVGALNSSSSIELLRGGSLTLFGAAVVTGSLTIDTGGTMDIQSNSLTINYAAGADPVAAIRRDLRLASDGGLWDGVSLTSSTVEAQVASAIKNPGSGVYAIGYIDGSADIGQTAVVGNQLVIQPTIVGDTDINGETNFLDLGRVAQNLGAINADWYHGDFNYDSTVNFLDIGLLAQNLNKTTINTPLGTAVSAGAAVVAPSTAGNPSPAPPLPSPGVPGEGNSQTVVSGVWVVMEKSGGGLFAEDALGDLLA